MARSYQNSSLMDCFPYFTTLRSWIFTVARATSTLAEFLTRLAITGFVGIISKVEVIERHADVITSSFEKTMQHHGTSKPLRRGHLR